MKGRKKARERRVRRRPPDGAAKGSRATDSHSPRRFSRRRLALAVAPALLAVVAVGIAVWQSRDRTGEQQSTVASADPPSPASVAIFAAATYVGAGACGQCHAAVAKAWRGSHHALAMQHATESTVLGDFNDRSVSFGGVTSRFYRRDGKFMVETDGADGKLQEYPVDYTFGVAPLQQYLVPLPGGRLQALPIAWDSRPQAEGGQRWFHLYPGETIGHDDPLHWTGLQFNWNYMCADCHSTNLRLNYDAEANRYATTWSEINVACETCHGPGYRHFAWARQDEGWQQIDPGSKGLAVALDERHDVAWTLDPQTGNSRRSRPLESRREIEACAFCHSRRGPIWSEAAPGAPIGDSHRVALLDEGLYFPDGQIRDEVYEYGSFLQSRMFHAGVTCSDCHEPHSLALRAPGNGVCLQCHAQEKYEAANHHHHAAGSPGSECAACHMPERTYMVIDDRRDHSIRIPRPDLSVTLGTPNACNLCHQDKPAQWAADQLEAWFPDPTPGYQNFAQTLHDGTLGAPGAREALLSLAVDPAQPAIARASALGRLDRVANAAALGHLRRLLADPDPLLRRAAVGAYAAAPASTLPELLPLLDDPVRDVRLETASVLATLPAAQLDTAALARRDRGIEEYIAAQRSSADRPEAHHNLGLLFMNLGRAPEAEAALKAALSLDPGFVPAAVTLADLYRAAGRDAEGEPILRALIARRPNEPVPHHALGLWLIRNGRTPEALPELKLAADLGAADPRYGYVYAVALSSLGDRPQALNILQGVIGAHPYDRDSLYALATFERDAGNLAAARSYAEQLVHLEPDNPDLAQLLRQLRQ